MSWHRKLVAATALVAVVLAAVQLWPSDGAREEIVVEVKGDLGQTLAAANLRSLLDLEGDLSRVAGVRSVLGPGTFVQRAVVATQRAIGAESGEGNARADLLVRLGLTRAPTLGDRTFVATLVYGSGTRPKPRFARLFPDSGRARIVVRPRPGLGDDALRALEEQLTSIVRARRLQGDVRVGCCA